MAVGRIRKGQCTAPVAAWGMTNQRRPAAEAQTLYTESDESRQQRHELYRQNKLEGRAHGTRSRRPDKHTRRKIRRFKQQ